MPRLKPAVAWAVCVALVAGAAIGQFASGPFLSFDLFYLVPALVAARAIGRNAGMIFAFVCAVLAVAVEIATGHPFTGQPLFAVWGGIMKLGVWALAVQLVSERQRYLQRMEALVVGLRSAASEIKQLEGLLPVCAWCRRMRTHDGTWLRLEDYLQETTNASVTHGICPECAAAAIDKTHK